VYICQICQENGAEQRYSLLMRSNFRRQLIDKPFFPSLVDEISSQSVL
jgi:hypothetical protein